MSESRRKRLDEYVEGGRLRDDLAKRSTDPDVVDLIVELCRRYCEPRRKPLRKRLAAIFAAEERAR
jgi:streptomycin 6-kinase